MTDKNTAALAAHHPENHLDMVGRWYMLNKMGMATLCASKADAEKEAADAQRFWPHMGPHRAVQLVEAADVEAMRAGYDAARLEIESLKAQLTERASHGQAPAQAAPAAVAGPSLQHIHDLLYTAQRTTGDAQAQAIAEARIALSDLMNAPEPVLATRAWPKVSGVSRDEGHPRALLVFFSAEPTDDEMRAVHGALAAAPATQPSPAAQEGKSHE